MFVKGDMKFMITDDLKVSPVSTLTSFALLKTLGINDASVLEVKNENVSIDRVCDSSLSSVFIYICSLFYFIFLRPCLI